MLLWTTLHIDLPPCTKRLLVSRKPDVNPEVDLDRGCLTSSNLHAKNVEMATVSSDPIESKFFGTDGVQIPSFLRCMWVLERCAMIWFGDRYHNHQRAVMASWKSEDVIVIPLYLCMYIFLHKIDMFHFHVQSLVDISWVRSKGSQETKGSVTTPNTKY